MSSKNPFKHSRELGVPRNQALGGSELSIRPAPTFFKRVLCSFVGELREALGLGVLGVFAASVLLMQDLELVVGSLPLADCCLRVLCRI